MMRATPTASHPRTERAARRVAFPRARLPSLAFGLIVVTSCALSGCGLLPPADDPASMTRANSAHPERMIIVAVANPPETLMLRAGSTARGYGAASGYSAGGSARATVTALARQYGLREVSAWPIPSLNVHCAMLEIVGDAPRSGVVAKLAADSRVNLAEPLRTFRTLGELPPARAGYVALQQGFREIGAEAAQKITRGDSIKIAVIDTGIDTTHPDLRDRIASTRNFVDDDWEQFNQDRHGTEVAGIIAADHAGSMIDPARSIEGVAPRAKIVAIKACWQQNGPDQSAVCHTFTLAEALQAALESHAQVVNLSLGGPPDPLLTELVALLVKRGVIVVGAVQPDGDLNAFPVGIPGVIAAEPAPDAGSPADNPGDRVLYAPGHNVLTLTPGGHYDFVSGSSFATAYIAATAALLVGVQPHVSAHDVDMVLEQTSGATKWHARMINVCRAMTAMHRTCTEGEQQAQR